MSKYRLPIQTGLEVVQMHDYPEAVGANDLGTHQAHLQLDSRSQLPWSDSGISPQHSKSPNVTASVWKPGVQPRRRKMTTILAVLLTCMTVVAISIGIVLGMQKFHPSSPLSSTTSTPSIQNSSTRTPAPAPTPTPISSSTNTSPFIATTPTLLALDCPDGNGKIITDLYIPSGKNFKYQITCGMDCQAKNIFPIWAYSLDMCMQACVSMNAYNSTNAACAAAVFRADMANVTQLGGNCYLKTGCDMAPQDTDIANAILIS